MADGKIVGHVMDGGIVQALLQRRFQSGISHVTDQVAGAGAKADGKRVDGTGQGGRGDDEEDDTHHDAWGIARKVCGSRVLRSAFRL